MSFEEWSSEQKLRDDSIGADARDPRDEEEDLATMSADDEVEDEVVEEEELLRRLKEEIILHKSVVEDEKDYVIGKVEEFESKLSNLTNGREKLWRKLKVHIKAIAGMSKADFEKKLFGTYIYDQRDGRGKQFDKITTMRLEHPHPKILKSYILYPESKLKQIWILILITLGIYTCFITPLRLTVVDDDSFPYLTTIEYGITILFALDILINFRSVSDDGVDDGCKIAITYICGWLLFDIAAIFPYEFFFQNELANLSTLAKLPRILRLFKIARLLKNKDQIKNNGFLRHLNEFFNLNSSLIKLVSFFLTMFVITHITGCLWLFSAKYMDYGPTTWVGRMQLDLNDSTQLYLMSIYWAVSTISTVGFGDISAGSLGERIFTAMWMSIGVGFYSYTIGTLSAILHDPNSPRALLMRKFAFLNSFAEETNLDRSLLEELMVSLENAQEMEMLKNKNDAKFLSDVPARLRFKVTENIYDGLAHSVYLFKGRDNDLIADLIPKLSPLKVKKGDLIYKMHSHATKIYILFKGRAVCLFGSDSVFREYPVGSYFGEIEIFKNIPRLYSVLATEESELMVLDRTDLFQILDMFPDLKRDMLKISIIRLIKHQLAFKEVIGLVRLKRVDDYWKDKENPIKEKIFKFFEMLRQGKIKPLVQARKEKQNEQIKKQLQIQNRPIRATGSSENIRLKKQTNSPNIPQLQINFENVAPDKKFEKKLSDLSEKPIPSNKSTLNVLPSLPTEEPPVIQSSTDKLTSLFVELAEKLSSLTEMVDENRSYNSVLQERLNLLNRSHDELYQENVQLKEEIASLKEKKNAELLYESMSRENSQISNKMKSNSKQDIIEGEALLDSILQDFPNQKEQTNLRGNGAVQSPTRSTISDHQNHMTLIDNFLKADLPLDRGKKNKKRKL